MTRVSVTATLDTGRHGSTVILILSKVLLAVLLLLSLGQ